MKSLLREAVCMTWHACNSMSLCRHKRGSCMTAAVQLALVRRHRCGSFYTSMRLLPLSPCLPPGVQDWRARHLMPFAWSPLGCKVVLVDVISGDLWVRTFFLGAHLPKHDRQPLLFR